MLDILITHFNRQHTSKDKDTSFKTGAERARYLRCFLRELHTEAGFKTLPDPRIIEHEHIQATVNLWKRRQFALATIQMPTTLILAQHCILFTPWVFDAKKL